MFTGRSMQQIAKKLGEKRKCVHGLTTLSDSRPSHFGKFFL